MPAQSHESDPLFGD